MPQGNLLQICLRFGGSLRKDLLDTTRLVPLVHGGKKRINPEIATQLADHSADDALTSREIEVLSLIAAGNSNKIIADQLAISEETVIFDLGADPIQIASHLSRDPKLRRFLKARPGLRVPGVWDGFETAVLAVLGQKLTVPGSKRSVTRLVQMFGTPIDTPIRGLKYLFPRPEVLAHADLSRAGISKVHACLLRDFARTTIRRHLTFSTLRTLEQTVSQVGIACGVDESTANYIAMRAFGEPDAFPSKELKLRRSITGLKPILSPAKALDLAEKWRPWRAYAAMHFAQ